MNLLPIGERINEAIKDKMKTQGHNLRDGIENSLKLTQSGNTLTCTAVNYARFVDNGVKANEINYPYARARIQGLTNYALARGMASDEKGARSIAFAIATKHNSKGMPTAGSYKYTKDGKRTGFVTDTLEEMRGEVRKLLLDATRFEIINKIKNGNNI